MHFISNTPLEEDLAHELQSAPEIPTFMVVIHPQAVYVFRCEVVTMTHVTFRYGQGTRLLIAGKMKAFLLHNLI